VGERVGVAERDGGGIRIGGGGRRELKECRVEWWASRKRGDGGSSVCANTAENDRICRVEG
jgi:hypothetical protein